MTSATNASDLIVHHEDGWTIFEAADLGLSSDSSLQLSLQPGLWRPVTRDAVRMFVFEVPPGLARTDSEFECFRDWAVKMLNDTPHHVDHSAVDELANLFAAKELTARARDLTSQGEIVASPDRLAVQHLNVAALPTDLTSGREAWLEELLTEAADRWRLVRIGLDPERTQVQAVIDLTGAPPTSIEALLRVAVDALKQAVEWILPPLHLLMGERFEMQALQANVSSNAAQRFEETVDQ